MENGKKDWEIKKKSFQGFLAYCKKTLEGFGLNKEL